MHLTAYLAPVLWIAGTCLPPFDMYQVTKETRKGPLVRAIETDADLADALEIHVRNASTAKGEVPAITVFITVFPSKPPVSASRSSSSDDFKTPTMKKKGAKSSNKDIKAEPTSFSIEVSVGITRDKEGGMKPSGILLKLRNLPDGDPVPGSDDITIGIVNEAIDANLDESVTRKDKKILGILTSGRSQSLIFVRCDKDFDDVLTPEGIYRVAIETIPQPQFSPYGKGDKRAAGSAASSEDSESKRRGLLFTHVLRAFGVYGWKENPALAAHWVQQLINTKRDAATIEDGQVTWVPDWWPAGKKPVPLVQLVQPPSQAYPFHALPSPAQQQYFPCPPGYAAPHAGFIPSTPPQQAPVPHPPPAPFVQVAAASTAVSFADFLSEAGLANFEKTLRENGCVELDDLMFASDGLLKSVGLTEFHIGRLNRRFNVIGKTRN